jgi:hypothetical protein
MSQVLPTFQRLTRPGWVWAITIWFYGWSLLFIGYAWLVYSGALVLSAPHRIRFDGMVSLLHVANIIVWAILLIGTAALFRLRKAAIYLFGAVLVGNVLMGAEIVFLKGWPKLSPIAALFSLSWPLVLCMYSRHLASKGVLR